MFEGLGRLFCNLYRPSYLVFKQEFYREDVLKKIKSSNTKIVILDSDTSCNENNGNGNMQLHNTNLESLSNEDLREIRTVIVEIGSNKGIIQPGLQYVFRRDGNSLRLVNKEDVVSKIKEKHKIADIIDNWG